ncbi:MAG: copper chaperone PCu(A)C [Betaproteobacteria bacterium]|nr:copper chaperone PCu(A)C [Betaproteobacteria bacterium]
MFRQAIVLVLIGLSAAAAHSVDYKAGDLQIGHPYARATPPGATVAGAYLSIENKGKTADKLLRAASPVAGLVELHSMRMDGNVMRMRAVPAIDVPAGASVKLAPGGLHVMLQELKRPLKSGERVPLTLVFERAGEVKVDLAVESASAAPAGSAHRSHADHGAHAK